MCNTRLDAREKFPAGMEEYLASYGWHFSKRLCEWAVGRMKKASQISGKPVPVNAVDRAKVEEILKRHNVDCSEFKSYDHVFVYHMAKADFANSSLPDEQHLALYVKDYLCDPDGYEGIALTRFYADCIGKGDAVPWEDVL